MVNQMEILQQQVAQLSANLANTQVQTSQRPRWNQQNQLTHRTTNFQTHRPIECWRCGEEGHIARECQSETPVKAQSRFQNQNQHQNQNRTPYRPSSIPQQHNQRNVNLTETEPTEQEEEIYTTTRILPRTESKGEQRIRTPPRSPKLASQARFVPHYEQPYNIVQDLGRHDANVTFGQLLRNPQYLQELKDQINKVEKEIGINIAQTHVNDNNKYTAARCIMRYKLNPIEVILDSGAAACIISTKLANKLKIKPNKSSDILVVTADGQRKRSLGIITSVPLILQGNQFTIDLQVIESPQDTLLLEINWFKTFDARLYFDHDELRAKIQNQVVKSSIKCIEEAKPYFRILANTAESEEEEYEDEALFETDLFQTDNEDKEETDSDSTIDKDELECIE